MHSSNYRCLLFLRGKNGGIVRNRGQFCFFCSQSRFSSIKTRRDFSKKHFASERRHTRRSECARGGAKNRCHRGLNTGPQDKVQFEQYGNCLQSYALPLSYNTIFFTSLNASGPFAWTKALAIPYWIEI